MTGIIFFWFPSNSRAESRAEKGRSGVWDGDGCTWKTSRFSFYSPFTVVFSLECKRMRTFFFVLFRILFICILLYLKHPEESGAHNRLSANAPSALFPVILSWAAPQDKDCRTLPRANSGDVTHAEAPIPWSGYYVGVHAVLSV